MSDNRFVTGNITIMIKLPPAKQVDL